MTLMFPEINLGLSPYFLKNLTYGSYYIAINLMVFNFNSNEDSRPKNLLEQEIFLPNANINF